MKDPRYIPPSVRMDILMKYAQTCVYCGAKKSDGVKIEIDHVIPVSHGGTSHPDNLVAACKDCNRGKAARLLVPIQDGDVEAGVVLPPREAAAAREMLRAEWERATRPPAWLDDLQASMTWQETLAAWQKAFSGHWASVHQIPRAIRLSMMTDGAPFTFQPDFRLTGRDGCDIGPECLVAIVPWLAAGEYHPATQEKIRAAAVAGYHTPTMILSGLPELFFGILVNERHKGLAYGRVIDGFLQPTDDWESSWHPDEDYGFDDLREPYSMTPSLLGARRWDYRRENFVGIACTVGEMEGSDGL